MLYILGTTLRDYWGPLRLLESYFFLAAFAFFFSVTLTWVLLPKLWHLLPRDKGRAFAVGAEKSIGKPVSAGALFVSLFCLLSLLVTPPSGSLYGVLVCCFAAMLVGFFDDKSGGFHEYQLAVMDLLLALGGSIAVFGFSDNTIWLPFTSQFFLIPAWFNLSISTVVVWISINALNCTDGVDGLSGSLSGLSLLFLAVLLYVVVGNTRVAEYLLVVHNPMAASWSLLAVTMLGCLVGYLWYNAPPSQVLMGDSGSRPIGFLLGILIVATNNPFVIFVVSITILINGATGLVKVAIMRFFKVGFLRSIRFPLHDHCRKNLQWSNSQVLLRFVLLHVFFSVVFLALLLKVR